METSRVVNMPQWITCSEAASTLGISPRAVRKRASTGSLKRKGTGRGTRYLVPGADTEPSGTDPVALNTSNGTDPEPTRNHTASSTRSIGGTVGNLALAPAVDLEAVVSVDVVRIEAQLAELYDMASKAVANAEHWKAEAERSIAYATGLRDALSLLRMA